MFPLRVDAQNFHVAFEIMIFIGCLQISHMLSDFVNPVHIFALVCLQFCKHSQLRNTLQYDYPTEPLVSFEYFFFQICNSIWIGIPLIRELMRARHLDVERLWQISAILITNFTTVSSIFSRGGTRPGKWWTIWWFQGTPCWAVSQWYVYLLNLFFLFYLIYQLTQILPLHILSFLSCGICCNSELQCTLTSMQLFFKM